MKASFKSIITAAAVAGVISAVVNSILYFIFHATGVISDDVYVQENQPLTLLPVLISSFIPSLLAGVVFYLLCRNTQKCFRYFSILAIILLLLSFANPFMAIKNIPLSMGIALNVMHIVVVASLLYFFKRIKDKPAIALR
jgi:drug/metabolite transporter (DMT)-like permease